jgi:hypothetical protein
MCAGLDPHLHADQGTVVEAFHRRRNCAYEQWLRANEIRNDHDQTDTTFRDLVLGGNKKKKARWREP